MTKSEAQKRADAKYLKEKVTQKVVRFYPVESDILEYAMALDNFSGHVKDLLREDMKKGRR